jgi:hypothetical protein
MGSILLFIPRGVFDDATTKRMGEAFDAACWELHHTAQADLLHEIMAKRVIDAARRGERSVTRLQDAALSGLAEANRI